MLKTLEIETRGQGLYPFTPQLQQLVAGSGLREGLCNLFIQHTSASLLVQENYDPSARHDLERWLDRLVPEHDPIYTHLLEGADDMPAHLKAALTASSLAIPIMDGRLALGEWQGVYVWEHRRQPHRRRVIAHLGA